MHLRGSVIISDLSSSDVARQCNGLMQLINLAQCGYNISDYANIVLSRSLRPRATTMVKRLGLMCMQTMSNLEPDTWNDVDSVLTSELKNKGNNMDVDLTTLALRLLSKLYDEQRKIQFIQKNRALIQSLESNTIPQIREAILHLYASLINVSPVCSQDQIDANVSLKFILSKFCGSALNEFLCDPSDTISEEAFSTLRTLCDRQGKNFVHLSSAEDGSCAPEIVWSYILLHSSETLTRQEVVAKLISRTQTLPIHHRRDAIRCLFRLTSHFPDLRISLALDLASEMLEETMCPMVVLAECVYVIMMTYKEYASESRERKPGLQNFRDCKSPRTIRKDFDLHLMRCVQWYTRAVASITQNPVQTGLTQDCVAYIRELAFALSLLYRNGTDDGCCVSCAVYLLESSSRILSTTVGDEAHYDEIVITSLFTIFSELLQHDCLALNRKEQHIWHILNHPLFISLFWKASALRERVVCIISEVILNLDDENISLLHDLCMHLSECLEWANTTAALSIPLYLVYVRNLFHKCILQLGPETLVTTPLYATIQCHKGPHEQLFSAMIGEDLAQCKLKGPISLSTLSQPEATFLYRCLKTICSPGLAACQQFFGLIPTTNSKRRQYSSCARLTGDGDPIQATANHIMDFGSSVIEFQLTVINTSVTGESFNILITVGASGSLRLFPKRYLFEFAEEKNDGNVKHEQLGLGVFRVYDLKMGSSAKLVSHFISIGSLDADTGFTVRIEKIEGSECKDEENFSADSWEGPGFSESLGNILCSSMHIRFEHMFSTLTKIHAPHREMVQGVKRHFYHSVGYTKIQSMMEYVERSCFCGYTYPAQWVRVRSCMQHTLGHTKATELLFFDYFDALISRQEKLGHYICINKTYAPGPSFQGKFLGKFLSLGLNSPSDLLIVSIIGSSLEDGFLESEDTRRGDSSGSDPFSIGIQIEVQVRCADRVVLQKVTNHSEFPLWLARLFTSLDPRITACLSPYVRSGNGTFASADPPLHTEVHALVKNPNQDTGSGEFFHGISKSCPPKESERNNNTEVCIQEWRHLREQVKTRKSMSHDTENPIVNCSGGKNNGLTHTLDIDAFFG